METTSMQITGKSTQKLIKFYGKHIEQQKADNFLVRIRTSEPLEKLQNVGRANQKSPQKQKQIDKLEPTPRRSIHRRQKYPEKITIHPRRQTDSNKSTAKMKNNFRIKWFTILIQTTPKFSNNNAGRADQKAGHFTNRDLGQDSNIGTTYFTGDNTNKSSTTPHIIQESLD